MTPRRLLSVLILTLLVTAGSGCGRETSVESRVLMDTIVTIKIPDSQPRASHRAMEKAFSEIERLSRMMNKYDQTSEVALINRLGTGRAITLSADTAFVIKKGIGFSVITNGSFDITISPLVDLWNSCKDKNRLPSQEEVDNANALVGYGNIAIDDGNNLSLLKDGAAIDLSGIAAGYIVDRAVAVLRENGITNAMINAGGDIFCLGKGPDGKGWRIGVKDPRGSSIMGTLRLTDRAVTTSGDYERFFVIEGNRYSQLIDPKSGYPISDNPTSVTVIAPDCITADALATGLFVMDGSKAAQKAEEVDGVEAIIVRKYSDSVKTEITSGISDIYEIQ